MRNFKNCLLAAVASIAVTLPVQGSAQEFKWDLADEYAPTSLPGEMDALFAKIVEQRSGGKIKITPQFGGAIGFNSQQHLEMVRSGAVPLASTPIHFNGGVDPTLEVGALPFLVKSTKQARLMYEIAFPYYEKALRKQNQIPIAATPWDPSGFWAKKPIDSPEALKGLKIRVYDVNGQLTMKDAGANPVTMGWGEIVMALATNGISGVLTSAEGGVNAKFWQYLDNFTEVNYATPLNMIHMNLDTWNALSPELQQIIREAGAEVTEKAFSVLDERRQANYETMRKNNMTVTTTVNPALTTLLQNAAKTATDRWLKRMGPDGEKILAEFRKRTTE